MWYSTTLIYHYDTANQLSTTSVDTDTFDADGNMTQGTRTYSSENQLIEIISGNSTIAQYEYNHDGLRSKKIAGNLTEYYCYDNGKLVYITNAMNNLKYSLQPGDRLDRPPAQDLLVSHGRSPERDWHG